MRILVTGGAGFIGSHLTRRLLETGHEVIVLDNLVSGTRRNFADLLQHHAFEFIDHDITEPIRLEVDQIYHLACIASPKHYQVNPINTLKTNVLGTLNVLGLAKRCDATMLLASTSEVYGNPKEHPQKESYWGYVNPIGVRSCYDEGKRCAETLTMDYYRQHDVQVRIVRVFNTYGPRMRTDDGRVVSNFITQALLNQDITIYGSGQQTRSFQYISDLVEGFILMMNNSEKFLGPVNMGATHEISITDFADRVLSLISESKSKIVRLEKPLDDPEMRRPDISLAKEKLDWEPKVGLEEGLQKTIFYFKDFFSSAA